MKIADRSAVTTTVTAVIVVILIAAAAAGSYLAYTTGLNLGYKSGYDVGYKEGYDVGYAKAPTPPPPPEEVYISVICPADYLYEYKTLEKFCEDYELIHPNVHITVDVTPWPGYYDSIVTRCEAGDPWDVIFTPGVYYGWIPEFADRGYLLPLEDWMERDLNRSDWPDGTWYQNSYKGHIWALTWNVGLHFPMINKRLWDEAGLTAHWDDPDYSWEMFAEDAAKLTIDRDGDGVIDQYGWMPPCRDQDYFTGTFKLILWAYGGDFYNEDFSEATFNSPEGVTAMKLFTDIYLKYKACPNPLEVGDETRRNAFIGETLATNIGDLAVYDIIKSENPALYDNLIVRKVPKGPAGRFSGIHGWSVTVAKASPHPEVAWDLIKFIVADPFRCVQYNWGWPPTYSAFEYYKFVHPDEDIAYWHANIAHEDRSFYKGVDMKAALFEAYQKIILEGADVKTALDEAAAKTNAILAAE